MSTAAAVSRWLFLLLSLSSWTIVYTKEARIVCYYTNWSVYRPGDAKFTPQNINPYLCTHLIYAFGGFTKENTLKPFDKYQDIEKGGYAKFTGLKTYNKNLKTLLAIGGWNEGSTRFSPLVASEERRKELVKNSVKFLRQNHFDGLDLDWEYPSFRDGGKPRDRANYAQFVQELREEFERESQKTGRPRLLLTMAVPAGIEYINKGYDVPKLTKYLDWMNILSYDYHSAFEPSVNHHAPLYPLEEDNEYNYDAELTIDYTIKHYLKLGADPSKLVLGIPTYGRSYTLFNPDAFEMGSPADGPGTMGEATRENGYLAYYEICEYVNDQDWEVEEPNPKAMGPYAFKDNQWVGYDDENMVKRKSEYVAENGLGGIMFWAIDNDDFRGKCHGKSYPLIEAGKEALLQAYGLTEDNLIAPPTKPIKSRTRNRSKTTETPNIKIEEKEVKIDKISSRRRNRIKPNVKEVEDVKEIKETAKSRRKLRRKQTSTTEEPITHSSLKVATPSYTTPEPPSTPDMGGAFKCEDEGFYPHPKDCKKYFWCLSGAGDSGLIAHQFTCPAGLYFNKAADSCDYTQNVLCNKKLQKPKTSTSGSGTSSSTTAAPIFSTSRVPPKITAATSKNTIRITSTTEAIEEEYEDEYEDEEEEKEKPSKTSTNAEPEEDPQVIKELIDLIKKAGGIEQLERQLQLNEKGDNLKDKTTESTIGKSLYERVLSKALKNTINSKKTSYTSPKNSRGQQSETSNEELKNRGKTKKGTLQYTSISRTRPSTAENEEEVVEEVSAKIVSNPTKLSTTFRKQNELQYVNIRRGRVSSTTEAPETNSVLNRNKILGEDSFEEEEEDDVKEGEREDSNENTKKTPQYVNIRRQRPSTTEGPATSKYVEIRRNTTESNEEKASDDVTSKYQTIRRVSTPAPTSDENGVLSEEQINLRSTIAPAVALEDSTFKYVNIRQSTTNNPSAIDDQKLLGTIAEKGGVTTSFVSPNTEAGFSVSETTTSSSSSKTDETLSNSEISSTKTTNDPIGSNQELFTVTDSTNTSNIRNITKSFSRPSFFITRTSTVRPTTESTTQSSKIRQTTRPHFRVGIRRKPSTFSLSSTTPRISSTSATTSTPSPFTFSRPTKIIPPRRKYFTQTTTSRILESQETSTKPQLELRKKILLRRTTLAPPTTQKAIPDNTFDQSLQPTHMVSSVEDSNESVEETSSEEAKKTTVIILPLTISGMFSSSNSNNLNAMTQADTVSHAKISTRAPQPTAIKHIVSTTPKFHRIAVKSTTPTYAEVTPLALYTTEKISKNPKPFQKTRPSSYFSQDKYEYYDDLESSILSMLPAQSKVLIHPNGDIECLDQGNFPHPAFCRKFISCARMEKGRIYGWEYTCPKGLSFDPIGGMCNWSADLGCNE